jgi:hypothetical protein
MKGGRKEKRKEGRKKEEGREKRINERGKEERKMKGRDKERERKKVLGNKNREYFKGCERSHIFAERSFLCIFGLTGQAGYGVEIRTPVFICSILTSAGSCSSPRIL